MGSQLWQEHELLNLFHPCCLQFRHHRTLGKVQKPTPNMKKATIPMSLMRETISSSFTGSVWVAIQFQCTFQNLLSWIWSSGLSTFPCSCHKAGSMDFHSRIHHRTSHQHRSRCCGSPGGLHCARSLGDFSSCADWSWQHCIHTVHTPLLLPCLQTHKHAAQMITYQIIN